MSGHQHCINCLQESDILYQYPCVACGWSPEQHSTSGLYLSPGTILHGQYQLARMLGHGGFGITYLAWDNLLEIKLAIKEYMPRDFATRNASNSEISTFAGDAKENFTYGLERFLDEARTLAKFQQHTGIVSVLNVFYGNSTGYMVMEYVDGLTLKEYLVDKDKLTWEQTLQLFMPVMDALRAVHKSGMLHRDISPDNIYLCQDNRVKLLDFGSARFALGGHSRSLSVIVKPGYAPEEQYRTKGKQGSWTDVYSVAASMYRCITGLVPPDALDRLDEDELKKPSVLGIKISQGAEKELMAALAIKAENRTQTIESLQDGLLTHSNGEPEPIVVKPKTKSKPQIITEPVTITPVDDSEIDTTFTHYSNYRTSKDENNNSLLKWWGGFFILIGGYLFFNTNFNNTEIAPVTSTSTNSNKQQPNTSSELSITAQIQLADKYYAAKDYKQAVTWFRLAANKGDAYAQYSLGYMYDSGKGVPKDYNEAGKWYRLSAEQGNASGQYNLGNMYQYGQGVPQDDNDAFKWYRLSAVQGNASAQYKLGTIYNAGQGVPQDYNEAVKWYQKAADQGEKSAQNNLGNMYADGKGVRQDYSKARDLYLKSAEQGVSVAQVNIGWYYMNGFGNLSKDLIDYKKAIYWNQRAADNGDSEGFNNLGWLSENGLGVERNLAKAADLYQSAVTKGIKDGAAKEKINEAQGRLTKINALIKANEKQTLQEPPVDAEAQIKLANESYKKKNYKQAIDLYRKAADQGNPAGQYNLGIMYEKGLGVKKDATQAIAWYQKGANQKDKDSLRNLINAQIKLAGQFYQDKNFKDSALWYRKVAELGNAVGQYNLGILYEKGLGVVKDDSQAHSWFQKAADQGDADAIKKLKATDSNQESIQENNPNITNDQTSKVSYAIGDKLSDGSIVFFVNTSGLHGLAAQQSDISDASWEKANKQIKEAGAGWSLPTENQLRLLYNQKEIVGGFVHGRYWSSTKNGEYASSLGFEYDVYGADKLTETLHVRAIHSF